MMSTMSQTSADSVATVRAFNRFYTGRIGVLGEGLLRTPHSLTEARVLYELGQRNVTEVADLRRELDIDAGFSAVSSPACSATVSSPASARRPTAAASTSG